MSPVPVRERLFGRERELEALERAFAEAGAGRGKVLLVTGQSGSGKTVLIQALRRPVRAKNGFFVEGKFNQFQRDLPLSALRQALGQLVAEATGADHGRRVRWREAIAGAVGELGGLLTELIPDLEQLLGPQPPVPEISPLEAPHRFAAVLRRFLGVFCRAEHPVVLFIDDWQWADAASLTVFRELRVDADLRYVLVVAASREEEVDAVHPFAVAVEELRRGGAPLVNLAVRPLSAAEIARWLGAVLAPAVDDLDGLAAGFHGATAGNPFFVQALLDQLQAGGELRREGVRGAWQWSRDPFADGGRGDVVQVFVRRLRGLSEGSRDLLATAACLGNCFELGTLALATGREEASCEADLRRALAAGLLVDAGSGRYAFRHDCVQQAAHALIPPSNLPAVQLRIGRLLVARLSPAERDERLLEVTQLLNAGRALLGDAAERLHLVSLNAEAGSRARAAAAYRAALGFFRVAGELLSSPGLRDVYWNNHYEIARQLFKDWAEGEFLEGERATGARVVAEAVARSRRPREQAEALCVEIVHATLRGRYPEALAAGRRALAALGVDLPEAEWDQARAAGIAEVRALLAGRPATDWREAPPMSDPDILAVTQVLITMGPPAYRSHPRLWSVLVTKVVALTLRHGPVPQVGYSHTAFAGLLVRVEGDLAGARAFGELAAALMDGTFREASDHSVFRLMAGSSWRHWFEPLAKASEDYALAWEAGLRSGNLQYAAYAFGHNLYCRFFQGTALSSLRQEARHALEFCRTRTNEWAVELIEGAGRVLDLLDGEEAARPASSAAKPPGSRQVECIHRIMESQALLLLGRVVEARAASDAAEPLLDHVGTQGLLPWAEHVFTRLLLETAAGPEGAPASGEDPARALALLEAWALYCPTNYRFKLALGRAEAARRAGASDEALARYEEAVAAARAGRFRQWEAWACERAADLLDGLGEPRLAESYRRQAWLGYHRWGAHAKVRLLEAAFLASLESAQAGVEANAARRAAGERHLRALRREAARQTEEEHPAEGPRLIEELTQATERLRAEVAERRRIEAGLAEQAALLDAAHEGILVKDMGGRIVYWNKGAERLYGWPRAEALGRVAAELLSHPEPKHAEALGFLRRQGEWQGELAARTRDGRDLSVDVRLTLVRDEGGRPKSILAIHADITERRRLEEQFLRAQRMESIGTLAGGMAHDLNNLLAPIVMGVGLLKQLDPREEVRALVANMERSAQRSADLIRQVLSYARGVDGARVPLQLRQVVRDVAGIVASTFPKNIVFVREEAPDLREVTGDPTQLNQVLINLCVNARDAMPEGGRLTLRTCNREVASPGAAAARAVPPGTYVTIEVGDTGTGIAPELLERIWDPFFTTKEVGKGTGLGLSTVLGIVRSHGGWLDVRSEPGRGSTFCVYLPARQEALEPVGEAAEVREEAGPPRGDGELILVVDDEASILTVTRQTLESFGYRVLTAEDGAQAIGRFVAHRGQIAAVLTDIMMPVMDGPALIAALRRVEPGVRIIAASGNLATGSGEAAEPRGVECRLAKPYTAERLLAVLATLLGKTGRLT